MGGDAVPLSQYSRHATLGEQGVGTLQSSLGEQGNRGTRASSLQGGRATARTAPHHHRVEAILGHVAQIQGDQVAM